MTSSAPTSPGKSETGQSHGQKILIVTQAVDRTDPILGFFHTWIEEFANLSDSVEVICLFEGEHALPSNVRVHSLGKESLEIENGTFCDVQTIFLSFCLIFKLRRSYDTVFVHMNPEYVVLGGIMWRLFGKRIGLWYTHKSVTVWLRIAEIFSHVIFTASSGSFRLQSSKVWAAFQTQHVCMRWCKQVV